MKYLQRSNFRFFHFNNWMSLDVKQRLINFLGGFSFSSSKLNAYSNFQTIFGYLQVLTRETNAAEIHWDRWTYFWSKIEVHCSCKGLLRFCSLVLDQLQYFFLKILKFKKYPKKTLKNWDILPFPQSTADYYVSQLHLFSLKILVEYCLKFGVCI